MARVTITPIQKRFSDVDSFLHVNNVSQQMYFDLGKTAYYDKVICDDVLLGRHLRIITASTTTSYAEQIRWDDSVSVRTTVERIGNKSMTLLQQIICQGRTMTESRSVMVAFDFEHQCSVEVPAEWRRRMEDDCND